MYENMRILPSINLTVNYKGRKIKTKNKGYFKNTFYQMHKVISVDEFPHHIKGKDGDFIRYEDKDKIIIIQEQLFLDFDSFENQLFFFKKDKEILNYNKQFGTFSLFPKKEEMLNLTVYGAIIDIYMEKLKHINIYLYEELMDEESEYLPHNEKKYIHSIDDLALNFIKVVTEFPFEFEKAIKINSDLVLDKIYNEDFNLAEGSDIDNIITLPKYVLDYIEGNNYNDLLTSIQKLDVNGNDYKILLEFFNNSAVLVKPSRRERTFASFTDVLSEIMTYHDYSLAQLLDYLIKEEFYYGNSYTFYFPLDTAILLRDYLSMSKQLGIESKRFPDLHVDHNILMRNVSYLENVDDEKFKIAVSQYAYMAEKFEDKDYIILAPESVEDMIEEGNDLSHCVASYTNNVLNGNSKIFFLRKKENIKESIVTIELDSNNNLNHAKGKFNREVDDEEKAVINRWLNEI